MTETEMIATRLGEVADAMVKMADAFAASIEHDARGRRRWYVFVTAFLVLIAFGTFHYGNAILDASATTHKIQAHQLDCTVPGGKCYEQKAEANRKFEAEIVKGVDLDIRGLVQTACNTDPRECAPGFSPQAPTTTSPTVP